MDMEEYLSMETEAHFQGRVKELAELQGWLYFHDEDPRRNKPGFPDVVVTHPAWAITYFWELKTEQGRVRPKQAQWIAALHRSGLRAAIYRPSDWPEIALRLKGHLL